MATKTTKKKTPTPPPPPNSDVLLNQNMVTDEVRITIEVYGATLKVEGSSLAFVRYAAGVLDELITGDGEKDGKTA